jgi:hypothetical protein
VDPEIQRFLLLLLGTGVFVVSLYFSWGELNYLVRGRTVAATSVVKRQTSGGIRNGPTVLDVTYEFPDVNGRVRRETDTVPLDWYFSTSGPVIIQFIPRSAESSRLSGHRHLIFVYVFAASFIPIGAGCYKFWKFYKS